MRKLEELNFYELLDLQSDAESEEIEAAYSTARQTYGAGSLAVYSVLSEEERASLLARINQAYVVLADGVRRSEYDRQLGLAGNAVQAAHEAPNSSNRKSGAIWCKVKAVLPAPGKVGATVSRILRSRRVGRLGSDQSLSSGSYLELIRKLKGLSLEDISESTKIQVRYLEALEKEDYETMPSGAYQHYILKALARSIDLDPEAVVDDFQRRVSN